MSSSGLEPGDKEDAVGSSGERVEGIIAAVMVRKWRLLVVRLIPMSWMMAYFTFKDWIMFRRWRRDHPRPR